MYQIGVSIDKIFDFRFIPPLHRRSGLPSEAFLIDTVVAVNIVKDGVGSVRPRSIKQDYEPSQRPIKPTSETELLVICKLVIRYSMTEFLPWYIPDNQSTNQLITTPKGQVTFPKSPASSAHTPTRHMFQVRSQIQQAERRLVPGPGGKRKPRSARKLHRPHLPGCLRPQRKMGL